ncbi:MAG: hypothetical protein J6S14_01400 [Clostridia bacterium]|nr:hypothetical protein [Clostridia bacterium]
MKDKSFKRYYLCSLVGVLIASFYPIWMGIKVVSDMIRFGTVYAEDYPKYIIPYTPIALAVIIGVALMPILVKKLEKLALAAGTGVSLIVFFTSELMLESMVTVTRTVTGIVSSLEGWQMYMCYIPPDMFEERTWTEVDVLMGEYSPAFKLHFYVISVVLIISILNCFYGFAKMIVAGDTSRQKPLILQSVASAAFLVMCIWACFTAFYRNGDITVSPLSAVLMCVFFLLFGVTVGIYVASFTLGKKKLYSILMPSLSAAAVTLVMYIGEMALLSGNLYRFGEGFLFEGMGGIVLAPVDIAVILLAGTITAIIASSTSSKEN